MILLCQQISATTASLLQDTRLQSTPGNGMYMLTLSASENTATNNATFSIQNPNGEIIADNQRILWSGYDKAGVHDDRTDVEMEIPVTAGGTLVIPITITGTCTVDWSVVYVPA